MDERNDGDKMEEIILPGFRFHPTDEELVGFYLKRKIQQRPLSIELIKQLDIYKYDPWDLPKLATTGEKEWYFYCPRDRKYRNSARPNRVTGAGFWKATGTDRPIYSSGGPKCIGLKKSLVFYTGRAAKGIKTDWMMHEFRLPSVIDSGPPKRFMDKNIIPTNESWAICKIFKKVNSNAQRALSHSWVSPKLPETSTPDMLTQHDHTHSTTQFSSDNYISSTTKPSPNIQYGINSNDLQQYSSIASFSPSDIPPYNPLNMANTSPSQVSISNGYTFLSHEASDNHTTKTTVDASSLLLNMSSSIFGDFGEVSQGLGYSGIMQGHYNSFPITLPQEMQENIGHGNETALMKDPNGQHFYDQWGNGFPFNLPSNFLFDSSPCPSEMSASYSTNKCYT